MYKLFGSDNTKFNRMGQSEVRQVLNDVDAMGPQFVRSKGGSVYVILKSTCSARFNMVKVTKDGLSPWSNAKERDATIYDMSKNGEYERIDGTLEVTLSVPLSEVKG